MASVLVTGSSGRIGRAVVSELTRRGHVVRGFDRVPGAAGSDSVVGSLTDRAALDHAMRDMDTLIHLAATPDDADFLSEILPNNLLGVYHVLESARLAGVKRLILASSGQVNWWQRESGQIPVRATDAASPRYWYAASKMFLESIGRGFAELHGLSVIIARLGWCPRTPAQEQEIAEQNWAQDVYISPRDSGRFFACAVEAPETVRFAVVFGAGRPTHQVQFDPSTAQSLLGFEPEDAWPEGLRIS